MTWQSQWAEDNQKEFQRILSEQRQMQALQSYGNSLANAYQPFSVPPRDESNTEERRMKLMLAEFDWNRAFDLNYFSEFFGRFPQ